MWTGRSELVWSTIYVLSKWIIGKNIPFDWVCFDGIQAFHRTSSASSLQGSSWMTAAPCLTTTSRKSPHFTWCYASEVAGAATPAVSSPLSSSLRSSTTRERWSAASMTLIHLYHIVLYECVWSNLLPTGLIYRSMISVSAVDLASASLYYYSTLSP